MSMPPLLVNPSAVNIASSPAYFVTGTHTNVGKTHVAAALLYKAHTLGLSCLGLKPITAGAYVSETGEYVSEDALLLYQASHTAYAFSDIQGLVLQAAIAPHLAAEYEQQQLSAESTCHWLSTRLMLDATFKVVEGAGGWRVPLNDYEFFSDIPIRLKLPVILVVSIELGCLNHALLTVEAILRDGLPLVGWVANHVKQDAAQEAQLHTLMRMLPAPCLGVIPFMPMAVGISRLEYIKYTADFLTLPSAITPY